MRVKILKKFKDVHDPKKVYKVGDVITVSKERFAEIQKNAEKKKLGTLVEEVKEKKAAE